VSGQYGRYSELVDSGLKWVGPVPRHWTPLRFKHALVEKKKVSNPHLDAGSISFGNVIYKNSETLSAATRESYQEVLAGEFLVNPLNLNFDLKSLRTALSEISVVVSTGYIVLRSNGRVSNRYMRWLLQEFDVAHMKTLGAGVRQTINYTDIGNSLFFEPPTEEQTQIAKFLDYETARIDALIEKQQQLLTLLKEKRQAVISHAVTKGLNPDAPMRDSGVEWLGKVPAHWQVLNLNRVVCTFVDYRGRTPEKTDGGRPLVTAGAIKNGTVDLNRAPQFVSEDTYHHLRQRGLPELGDLLFTSEAPLGEVAIVEDVEIACAQRIIMFKLDRARMKPHFMWLYLRSQVGRDEIQTKASGSTAEGIRADRLRRCRVLVPSIDEQDSIVAHVASELSGFDELLRMASEQNGLLQERRTALISAAVTGKIDVRSWTPPNPEVP
jgi:type I restriction enzyme S subunit